MGRLSNADLSHWTSKVMQYYRIPVCFLALDTTSGGMYLKGRHGIDTKYVALPSICHHSGLRELPVIVANTEDVEAYRDDILVTGPPYAHFYVGVPLLLPMHKCIGTLCIMDPTPRSYFSLKQCAYMVECAKRIGMQLHKEVENFLCMTVDSLQSMRTSGSEGQQGTCESLDELDFPRGTTPESFAAGFATGTVDSLVAIPENSDVRNFGGSEGRSQTLESLDGLDGGNKSSGDGCKATLSADDEPELTGSEASEPPRPAPSAPIPGHPWSAAQPVCTTAALLFPRQLRALGAIGCR